MVSSARLGVLLPLLCRGAWLRPDLRMCVQTERPGHQGGRSVKQHKVRQHVNPLRSSHQTELALPLGWAEEAFSSPSQHTHVDIGSARGLWCLDLAQRRPDWNVVGIEIRRVLAEAAQEDAKALGLDNLRFFACNANVNLEPMIEKAAPSGTRLNSVSLQFPDPWFKAKHHKRRTLQPPLVQTLSKRLEPGGWLLLQTDVHELAVEMREMVREHAGAVLIDEVDDVENWDAVKPPELLGLTTERERACFELGRPIYRCLFRKRVGTHS